MQDATRLLAESKIDPKKFDLNINDTVEERSIETFQESIVATGRPEKIPESRMSRPV